MLTRDCHESRSESAALVARGSDGSVPVIQHSFSHLALLCSQLPLWDLGLCRWLPQVIEAVCCALLDESCRRLSFGH